MLRLLLLSCVVLLLTQSGSKASGPQSIHKFYFTSEDILSWRADTIQAGAMTQPAITFRLTNEKGEALSKLTKEITNPMDVNPNLIIYYNNEEIATLRVAEPMSPEAFGLQIAPDRLAKLKATLPRNKNFALISKK